MFEKCALQGSINSLLDGLVVLANCLRVSLLELKIKRVSFAGVNKDLSELIEDAFCMFFIDET